MERKLIDMAPTMHPRLINDHRLLPEEVMECECGCVIVPTDTLQLRNNFEECAFNAFNQSTKSASKKEGIHVMEVSGQLHATAMLYQGKNPRTR